MPTFPFEFAGKLHFNTKHMMRIDDLCNNLSNANLLFLSEHLGVEFFKIVINSTLFM